ncbi:DUF6364 family protein [Anaerococcus lactolyticus]|jgi:predicted transcriptional regulator|nr:DUF6364 family protein [Anaerococcus lactolyticus]
MKTITVRLDDELHKKFKIYALENNKSMQEIIEEYIKKIIKEKNK